MDYDVIPCATLSSLLFPFNLGEKKNGRSKEKSFPSFSFYSLNFYQPNKLFFLSSLIFLFIIFYLLSSLQVSNHTYGKCSGKKQERKIIFTSYGD